MAVVPKITLIVNGLGFQHKTSGVVPTMHPKAMFIDIIYCVMVIQYHCSKIRPL